MVQRAEIGNELCKDLAAFMDCITSYVYRHERDQLAKLPPLHYFNARIRTLEREWGADEVYLKHHRSEYLAILKRQYLNRIRELLAAGRTTEASKDLARIGEASFKYHVLSHLPSCVVRRLLTLRKLFSAP